MADPARRRARYEDFLAVPAHLVAEILDGELHTQPRPAARHAVVSSALGGELFGPFQRGRGGPGGWRIILDEPELHLHGDILVPDLAGWRRERMPVVPDAAAFELPPDWVCEALSPATAATDRSTKRDIYRREDVRWLWLIERETRTLEVFVLERADWKLAGTWQGEQRARAVPFDAIELELAGLWTA